MYTATGVNFRINKLISFSDLWTILHIRINEPSEQRTFGIYAPNIRINDPYFIFGLTNHLVYKNFAC